MREFVAGDRVIANFLSLNNGEAKYSSTPGVVISKGGYVYSVLVYTSSTLVLEAGSVAGIVFLLHADHLEIDTNPPPFAVGDKITPGQSVVVPVHGSIALGIIASVDSQRVVVQFFSDNEDCPYNTSVLPKKCIRLYREEPTVEEGIRGALSPLPELYKEVGTVVSAGTSNVAVFSPEDVPAGTKLYVKINSD